MTRSKTLIMILACLIAGILVWWLKPHYSKQDEAYYVAVFCTLPHDDSSHFTQAMKGIIEGGNSDYALKKIAFIPALGKHTTEAWNALTPAMQQEIRQDNSRCKQVMSAQLEK